MLSVEWSTNSKKDLEEISNYIAQNSLQSALGFLDAAEKAVTQLAGLPNIGSLFETDKPQLKTLKVWPIPSFPNYLLFYRLIGNRLQIVRILHGSRDIVNLLGSFK